MADVKAVDPVLMQLKIALFNTFYEEPWFETVMHDAAGRIVLVVNRETEECRSLAANGWEGIPIKIAVHRLGTQDFNNHVIKGGD